MDWKGDLEEYISGEQLGDLARRNNPLCREYDSFVYSKKREVHKKIRDWEILLNQIGMYGPLLFEGVREVYDSFFLKRRV